MKETPPTRGVLCFDAFEVNLRTGEVRKHGFRIKLQDQPFRILDILLENAGELVTREELQRQIWPADTFVDFEKGLNNAVKRLRDALGDSAEHPLFIETISKRGYRFIAPVRANGVRSAAPIAGGAAVQGDTAAVSEIGKVVTLRKPATTASIPRKNYLLAALGVLALSEGSVVVSPPNEYRNLEAGFSEGSVAIRGRMAILSESAVADESKGPPTHSESFHPLSSIKRLNLLTLPHCLLYIRKVLEETGSPRVASNISYHRGAGFVGAGFGHGFKDSSYTSVQISLLGITAEVSQLGRFVLGNPFAFAALPREGVTE